MRTQFICYISILLSFEGIQNMILAIRNVFYVMSQKKPSQLPVTFLCAWEDGGGGHMSIESTCIAAIVQLSLLLSICCTSETILLSSYDKRVCLINSTSKYRLGVMIQKHRFTFTIIVVLLRPSSHKQPLDQKTALNKTT